MTAYESSEINVNTEPVQKLYKYELSRSKIFEYKSLKNNTAVKITPVAYYKISGQVVAHNTYFPLKTWFDRVALYDIGMVWDRMAQNDFFKSFCKAKSEQVITENDSGEGYARYLSWNCHVEEQSLKQIGYTWMDMDSHISHTHIIPANYNIMAALNTIRKYDIVELEGELVNVKIQGENEAISSLERNDDDGSAIGGGACEIMYVTRVKIGHKVYQ